jgi:hypothetical protein
MKKALLLFSFLFCFSTAFAQTFFEGFENTTAPDALPSTNWTLGSGNWAVFDNGVGLAQRWGINPALPYQGTNAAYVNRENIGAGNTSKDFLATPAISIPTNGVLKFSSRSFTSGNQGTIYEIYVAPATASQTDPAAYSLIAQYNENEVVSTFNIYEEKTVDLSPFAGTQIYIAFVMKWHQTGVALGDRWLVDNVSVDSSNECNTPSNLHANYSDYNTVNFSWYNNGLGQWEVMILPCGTPPPVATDTGTIVTINSYQFTGLTPNSCYTAYIRNTCPDNSSSSWQGITPPLLPIGHFVLTPFIDYNNNGIKEPTEPPFIYGNFTSEINNSGNVTYLSTNNNSMTIMAATATDTYDFGFQINNSYPFTSYYSLGNFNFNDIPSPPGTYQTLYFPVVQTANFYDTEIYYGPILYVVPGTSITNFITIGNYGQPTSGTLTFTKVPASTITNVDPPSNVILNPEGFTYTFSNLGTFQGLILYVTSSIAPIPYVNLGETLYSNATVTNSAGVDISPANNSFTLHQFVAASYDPNDIVESHGNFIQYDQWNSNDYLYYTINFQNTGTANTSIVKVENMLDSRIDEASVSMVNSSHNYVLERSNNHLLWNFYPISLTPASTNEEGSKGYITYKAKLKPGYAIGDIIPNTASIYFDTNPAIVTNTFNTEFVQSLQNPSFTANTITLYPNPASNSVQITNSLNETITNIALYEVSGKLVKQISETNHSQISVDLQNLAKGMYFVEITTASNTKQIKKLIIQ